MTLSVRPRRILLVALADFPETNDAVDYVELRALQAGIKLSILRKDPWPVPGSEAKQPKVGAVEAACKLAQDCDLVLVLGGDGSFLRAAYLAYSADIPVIGVNLGHVGFLAESEATDLDNTLTRVFNSDFIVSDRMTIDVTVQVGAGFHGEDHGWKQYRKHDVYDSELSARELAARKRSRQRFRDTNPSDLGVQDSTDESVVYRGWALNEMSLGKEDNRGTLEAILGVDGQPVSAYQCDGMLVATPTGSTAYVFSAGGPVLWPQLEAILAMPNNAHGLFTRPLVVSPESVVTVSVGNSQPGAVVFLDGFRRIDIAGSALVTVTHGSRPVRWIRLNRRPFADRLVQKFQLPVRGWRDARRPSVED